MTTETKYTPGPWRVYLEGYYWVIAADYVAVKRFGEVPPIVTEIRDFTDTEKADAHLIAAAPELLAALQDLLDFAETYDPSHHASYEDWSGYFKDARTAIAKAIPDDI